ncbi:MAG: type II toxin-antitoxin system HicB family antitoxin [Thermotogota bacterium]|nr:type II toxin-antitoxin system HicB family antitoxin [Thermotogota bacterium]
MKKKNNWYSYIAIFNCEDDGINVSFPDLPGCLSCADTTEEAIHNAKEAMGLYLYDIEMENENFPVPSSLKTIELGKNDISYLVEVFMPEVRASVKDVYVKKTLTVPASIAYKAEKAGVNFSKVLREALDEYLKEDEKIQKAN